MPPLTVKQLGKKGRFANQLFQYAHLRQRARDANTDYCCPPWVGQQLFGLHDPPVTKNAVDIGFSFPLDSKWYDKELFRGLFVSIKNHDLIRKAVTANVGTGPMIGLHLRRGDYGTFRRRNARWAFVAPTQWYTDWLDANLARFPGASVFIASDEPDKVLPDFAKYHDFYWKDNFAADFYLLTQCDVLLISNSSFGFAASMLNECATEFWRPRLSEKQLIRYDPWASPIVFTDERYP